VPSCLNGIYLKTSHSFSWLVPGPFLKLALLFFMHNASEYCGMKIDMVKDSRNRGSRKKNFVLKRFIINGRIKQLKISIGEGFPNCVIFN